MLPRAPESLTALRQFVRAHPRVCGLSFALALVAAVLGAAFSARQFLAAQHELVLRMDVAGAPELALTEGSDGEPLMRIPLRYPTARQDWDVRIEATGEKNPNAWDMQIWVQSIGSDTRKLPWSEVWIRGDWRRDASQFGSGGTALVAEGEGQRALGAQFNASELRIVYSRNAWNGIMRVTINGETQTIDTWRKDFALGEIVRTAAPGPGDRLLNHTVRRFVSLGELHGRVGVSTGGVGSYTLHDASYGGTSLDLDDDSFRMPLYLTRVWLPAIAMGGIYGLCTLLLLPAVLLAFARHPYVATCVLVAALKFWLISGDEMRGDPWDASGYARSALSGVWNAPFALFGYERQPVFASLIALNRFTGLPLRISIEVLYLGASLLLAGALPRYRLPRWTLPVSFALLAFSPLSFPGLAYSYQDMAYAPLFLLTLAGVAHALAARGLTRIGWSVVAGIGCALTWNTRPEHVLLLGLFFGFGLLVVILDSLRPGRRAAESPRPRLGASALEAATALFAPLVLTLGLTLFFSGMGRTSMGAFATSNFQLPGFTALYKELLAIQPQDPQPYWPVPPDVRKKAYKASPTLSQLEPFLEGGALDTYGELSRNNKGPDDFGIFFFWGLRMAPWLMQDWQTADQLDRFYQKAADELALARKAQFYDSRPVWSPFVDPAVGVWAPYVWDGVQRYWHLLSQPVIEGLYPQPEGTDDALFNRAHLRRSGLLETNQALWSSPKNPATAAGKRAAAIVGSITAWAALLLVPVALIILLWRLIRRRDLETLLPLALFALLLYAFCSRFALVSIMHAVAFRVESRYILPVAPLLPLLTLVSLCVIAGALPLRRRPAATVTPSENA